MLEFSRQNNTAIQQHHYRVKELEFQKRAVAKQLLPQLSLHADLVHNSQPLALAPDSIDRQKLAQLDWQDSVVVKSYQTQCLLSSTIPTPLSPSSEYHAGFTIRQTLGTDGVVLNRLRERSYRLMAEQKRLQTARVGLGLLSHELFWSLVVAHEQIRALSDRLVWIDARVKELDVLHVEGSITDDEFFTLRTKRATLELELLRAEHQLQQRQDEVIGFCNLPAATRIQIDSTALLALYRSIATPHPVAEQIVYRRDDIIGEEFELCALENDLQARWGEYLPHSELWYHFDYTNTNPQYSFKIDGEWRVGLRLRWDLFDWGARLHEIQAGKTVVARKRLDIEQLSRDVELQLGKACRRLELSLSAERIALQLVADARRGVELAELKYREGVATVVQLLDRRSDFTAAEQVLLQARIDKLLAWEAYRIVAAQEQEEGEQ
jgi:outer membrane protein TolC